MNIGKVDSSTNVNTTPVKNDSIIGELEKVKAKLQEEIQKTNESKISDEIKKDRINTLKQQIQQIDMQIQQIQTERLNKNQKKLEEGAESNTKTANGKDSISLTVISDLAKINTTYSAAKIIDKTKNGLDLKAKVLKTEIKLDAGRRRDDTVKQAELSKIQLQSRVLSKKLGETMGKVQDEVKEVAENASQYVSQEDNNEDNQQLKKHNKIDAII